MRYVWLAAALLAAPAAFAGDFEDQILAVHNSERAAVGSAPLTWSASLSADAQVWADHLAATSTFEHAPNDPEGENLWMGTTGAYQYSEMAQSWADEKASFTYGTFPDVSTDGNWATVGHYTQMIWSGTTEVGCAEASDGKWDYLVCRYNPPGNYMGEKPY